MDYGYVGSPVTLKAKSTSPRRQHLGQTLRRLIDHLILIRLHLLAT